MVAKPQLNTDRRVHAPQLDGKVIAAQMKIVGECIGAWRFQVLNSCLELQVFEALAEAPKSAREVSRKAGVPEPSMRRLLDAGVAVDLLAKEGDAYANREVVSQCLVTSSTGYLGNWVALMAGWWEDFGKLTDAVRTNGPVVDLNAQAPPEKFHSFIRGMVDYASYRGSNLIRNLDLSDRRHLLDLGGGPGVYSILFCDEYPQLRCTNFDRPSAIAVARGYVDAAGLQDRITLRSGDYRSDPLGDGYDAAFLSHVLHQEPPGSCSAILRRILESLTPGGLVVVQAMFPDESRTGPVFPVLHDLLCLLVFPGGMNHSVGDTQEMLEDVGFEDIEHRRLAAYNVNSLVVARRPYA